MGTISRILKQITTLVFKEFIYGGHFQSFGAAGIAFVACVLLNIEFTWDGFIVVYLMFYPLYLYNRYKELDIDETTNPDRTRHFRNYIKIMPVILWSVIFLVIGMVIFYSNIATLGFSLVLLILGMLYTVFFKKVTRNIIIFKNLYVSAFFSSLVFYPVVYFEQIFTTSLLFKAIILAVFVYLKAFIMQVFLDIKDIESDKKERLLTIPTLLGKYQTIRYLQFFDFGVSIVFPVIFSLVLNTFSGLSWVFALATPFLFYCYKLVKEGNYYGYILRSGEFLSWFFMMLLLPLKKGAG